jgi:hypothetical protein
MRKFPAIHPALYIAILALSLAGTYVFKLRTQGIFSCTPEGYREDRYLGYCSGAAYGDYDHGAVWFNLVPDVQRYAAETDVLFVGSSRMQFALSTIATDEWFAAQGASHYLLGFTHTENVNFLAPLLAAIKPKAKVYVVSIDRFFSEEETGPTSEILHDRSIASRYRQKHTWQVLHKAICHRLPGLCGQGLAYFRAVRTGHWVVRGTGGFNPATISVAPPSNQDKWGRLSARAEEFIKTLPVDRNCVVLTLVPYPAMRLAEADAIAAALNMELINPQVDDLWTFDQSHMDKASTERWSKAFYAAAGPRIRQCLVAGG